MNEFYKAISYGAVEFKFTVLPRYVRMSKNAEDYGIERSRGDLYRAFYREALANAAKEFDIGGYDVAYVMASPQTPNSVIRAGGPAFVASEMTEDGEVPLGTATGSIQGEPAFRWMAHETGHFFGFVDLYDATGLDNPSGVIGLNFGWWDIMSMPWEEFSLEINGWFRFQRGWLSDKSVLCFNAKTLHDVSAAISNLSNDSNRRLIVVRLDEHRAIAIERRSITRFAPMHGNAALEGVIIYQIDGAKVSRMAPVKILKKDGLQDGDDRLFLAALRKGESASGYGLHFEVTDVSDNESRVRIRKQGG
jgi:M6 family metalloprotease-like protein